MPGHRKGEIYPACGLYYAAARAHGCCTEQRSVVCQGQSSSKHYVWILYFYYRTPLVRKGLPKGLALPFLKPDRFFTCFCGIRLISLEVV